MVFNAVTPSGTNDVRGYLTYRFRRAGMNERPFFLSPTARKPDNNIDNFTATLGGPIVKDRWHYYLGYEYVDQDLRDASKVIQQSAVNNAQTLGLSSTAIPPDGVIPTQQRVNFAIAKTDYQISPEHKLSARYFFFKNRSPYNIGGGLNTVERATDFNDRMDSASVQLISSFGVNRLNELRVQFARRHQFRTTSENAGACPAIVVSGIANFGCPLDATQSAGFDFSQKIWQVSDNFTWIRGKHSVKAGFDLQFVADDRVNTLRQIYTFPSVDAYLVAKSGDEPARLHQLPAGSRRSERQLQLGLPRRLRPGRLPRQLELQAPLRAALRPVRHPGRAAVRGQPALAVVQEGQEQLRTPSGLLLEPGPGLADGRPRLDGDHVRAAAPEPLRGRDPAQRRSQELHRHAQPHERGGAGVPRDARRRCLRDSRCRPRASTRWPPTSTASGRS